MEVVYCYRQGGYCLQDMKTKEVKIREEIEEEWLPVFGFEGKYYVSNLGNVCGVDNKGDLKNNLKPECSDKHYQRVLLSDCGKRKHKLIHVLVAESFVEGKTE